MSVAVPIAPRFFVLLLALAASLTLDLLFFFGARGSSASFTFFAFDRGAGGGHEPPLTVSARIGRGRASAATVKAASSRARARAMAPLLLRVAQWCCRPAEPLRHKPTATDQVRWLAAPLDRRDSTPWSLLQRAAPTPQPQVRRGWFPSVFTTLVRTFAFALWTTREYYGLANRFELIVLSPWIQPRSLIRG